MMIIFQKMRNKVLSTYLSGCERPYEDCRSDNNKHGFALLEILIAVTILSIVVVSLYSGVSAGSYAIAQNKNLTRAVLIARSKLNEFKIEKFRTADTANEPVKDYDGYTYSRETKRFEHELLGPLAAEVVTITVKWQENYHERSYSIQYIYQK